jgi:hypothetical protein
VRARRSWSAAAVHGRDREDREDPEDQGAVADRAGSGTAANRCVG